MIHCQMCRVGGGFDSKTQNNLYTIIRETFEKKIFSKPFIRVIYGVTIISSFEPFKVHVFPKHFILEASLNYVDKQGGGGTLPDFNDA